MTYRAPLTDIRHCFDNIIDFQKLAETERFADATPDVVDAILTEVGRLAEQALGPLQTPGDTGSRLVDGQVQTPTGFKAGYDAVRDGGWVGLAATPDYGGMGLPLTLQMAANEMISGACLSLSLCPLLSQGAIDALAHHATDDLKEAYLGKLISGEWTGTMNLTEPQAGSDLAALKSKAEPVEDGYKVTGQKIYISWGDHDLTDNIVHLVLARLPDAPAGSKGLSLFLVPKVLPDGTVNAVKTVSLEHKLGLHGSPTCVLSFEGAQGWIVGEAHNGLACMFTMMNNARLGVGMEGVGVAQAAFQKAKEYANERVQGKAPVPANTNRSGKIVDHADVRRMLIEMRAHTEASRAIALETAFALDMAHAAPDSERATWAAFGSFLTPIAKSYGTSIGMLVAELGVQVHGGMGFIEDTGAAQYSRDVRVTAIYEGTNGVQAGDLVGRKLQMDGGQTARSFLEECRREARLARCEGAIEIADCLDNACKAADTGLAWMLQQNDIVERLAGSSPFLTALAYTRGAALLSRGARGATASDMPKHLVTAKWTLARFYATQVASHVPALIGSAVAGSAVLYDFDAA